MTPDRQAALEQVAREWLEQRGLTSDFNLRFGGDVRSLANLLAAQRAAVLEAVDQYAEMRLSIAEPLLHAEILAGNVVKEARERAAMAELHGLQSWVKEQRP